MDDILITGNNNSATSGFIRLLNNNFSLKDLGMLQYFLGAEVIHTSGGIFLCQRIHISDVLLAHNMAGVKLVSTPISTADSLILHDGSPPVDANYFQKIVRAL